MTRWLFLLVLVGGLVLLPDRRAYGVEQQRTLASSRCRTDADCGGAYNCFLNNGLNHGVCIPTIYAASDTDDEDCTYKATCTAAGALHRICPECVLEPMLTCDGIRDIATPWFQERWTRFVQGCLKLTPEQKAASKPPSLKARRGRGGIIEVPQMPSLGFGVNGWGINAPPSWAGSEMADWSGLYERQGQLQKKLSTLSEFKAACPSSAIDATTNVVTVTAGTCGGFRNPNPTGPPPSVTYR